MFKRNIYLFCLLSATISAKEVLVVADDNTSSRKNDAIQFAVEIGAKTNFWSPGIPGNVLDYDTEGLYLGFGKLKLKLYNNDVFTVEKYGTFSGSAEQDELLGEFKDDRKHESAIDGIRITLQVMKVINFLFEKEWLTGLNYEFNTRNFLGDATLLQNSKYWYGSLTNAVPEEDFTRLEAGTNLAFKTKFTSHKLSYRFEDFISFTEGDYFSIGAFDEEWSKPTFIGDSLLGEEPLLFDANYYVQGISTSIGVKTDNYLLEGYFDYGLNTEMDIIQRGDNYSSLNKDVGMYRLGATAKYIFNDVYTNSVFATDIVIGAEIQQTELTQGGGSIDAETLYGINAGLEVTF